MKNLKFKKDGSISQRKLNEQERLSLWSARRDVRDSRGAKEHECSDATCDEYISHKITPSGNFEFLVS